jgi:hypothetical protein
MLKKIKASAKSGTHIPVTLTQLLSPSHIARMGERSAHRVLVEKPKGRRPIGRPRHRWEDNIKTELQEVGWGSMDWINGSG